jgi:Na+/melibiose symporter-like transporter
MIADVVEDSQVRTGRRSEGLFFAAMSFVNKAVSGIGAFLAGQMLTFVSFPQQADPATLDPSIIRHLALLYVPMIVALYGTGMVILSGYRINRAQHEDNLRRLAESESTGDTPAIEVAAETQAEMMAAKAGLAE